MGRARGACVSGGVADGVADGVAPRGVADGDAAPADAASPSATVTGVSARGCADATCWGGASAGVCGVAPLAWRGMVVGGVVGDGVWVGLAAWPARRCARDVAPVARVGSSPTRRIVAIGALRPWPLPFCRDSECPICSLPLRWHRVDRHAAMRIDGGEETGKPPQIGARIQFTLRRPDIHKPHSILP